MFQSKLKLKYYDHNKCILHISLQSCHLQAYGQMLLLQGTHVTHKHLKLFKLPCIPSTQKLILFYFKNIMFKSSNLIVNSSPGVHAHFWIKSPCRYIKFFARHLYFHTVTAMALHFIFITSPKCHLWFDQTVTTVVYLQHRINPSLTT